MKTLILTKEYPPNVYGGAGVHVEFLVRELARVIDVEVRCFGAQKKKCPHLIVTGCSGWEKVTEDTETVFVNALDAFSRSLAMASKKIDADVVHCHTWYTDMGGFLAKKLWGIPLVVTTHSLEPLRPWKFEQLGRAYNLSSWMEKTAIEGADAVIAVSRETKKNILKFFDVESKNVHVIHNGIDTEKYKPTDEIDVLKKYGVTLDKPYVLFVGRITRQKGILHLVNAIPFIDPSIQVVLCAGAPDTEEIEREMTQKVLEVSSEREGVVWIKKMLPRNEIIQFYTHAAVFCCPSVYEPFGIINLEAMACGTAVVASGVGGIKDVVVHEETGILVDLKIKNGTFDPVDPKDFSLRLAQAINLIALDSDLRERLGVNGRERVEKYFSWKTIAEKTVNLYRTLV